jgi:UbiD family decarboxylase
MARRNADQANDLRFFIEALADLGELRTVDGADWNLEIGALTEIGADQNSPALLFERIKGYPAGYRVLSNILTSQKLTALILGLSPELSEVELLNTWRSHLSSLKPLPPQTVTDGPILENVMEGEAVDLESFPVPLWHEKDGGRYIGTGCAVITKDPDGVEVNLGTYRCML